MPAHALAQEGRFVGCAQPQITQHMSTDGPARFEVRNVLIAK
jgi:hypothetical protein